MFPAEYLLWERCSVAVLLAFAATLFPLLDLPVFCSVLLSYFVIVVVFQAKTVSTRRRDAHARNICDVSSVVQ